MDNDNFDQYWATVTIAEEVNDELGSEELKRIALDAHLSKDIDAFKCSGSNTIGLRRLVDPFYTIRSAEWGSTYPSSVLDMHMGRWKDEGQNHSLTTKERIIRQPIIFEEDPLDTEEPFDDYAAQVETNIKLERYIESGRPEEPNLLKLIGIEQADKTRGGLDRQNSTQIYKEGNLAVENFDIDAAITERVLGGIPKATDYNPVMDSRIVPPDQIGTVRGKGRQDLLNAYNINK